MYMQRNFLLVLVTMAATPAVGQAPSAAGTDANATHGGAPVPDFTRVWTHPVFPWFEPPASGPGPITNLSR